MKILVLSDSHSALRLMRSAVSALKPNAIVHLGDYYDDGLAIGEENPHIPFYQVPGNCDRYRLTSIIPETICCDVCGVRLFMTHGHRHMVKMTRLTLEQDARASHAQAALYGHTHEPDCRLVDGMWVLNPGSCGHGGGTVGLIEVEDKQILSCKILREEDWMQP